MCSCKKIQIIIILLSVVTSYGAPDNGDFLICDSNDGPLCWEYCNGVKIEETVFPDLRSGGSCENWRIDVEKGLKPISGKILMLTTGTNDELESYAQQIVTFQPGDVFKTLTFFGSCDAEFMFDYGVIELDPIGVGSTVEILRYSFADTVHYNSYGGWKRNEWHYPYSYEGDYYIRYLVSDGKDIAFTARTQMAVNSSVICPDNTGEADLNCDCYVDFVDFALFAGDWLVDCNDRFADCLLGTDFNGDSVVDYVDLNELAQYWNCGERVTHSRIDFGNPGVDFMDFARFANWYGEEYEWYDLDGSGGVVDLGDLAVFSEHWLK